MKLTALEIKQQEFEKSLRGYDKAEVQAFLNLMSNEWEHMVTKNRELENRIDELEDKLKHYERVEEALHETLQTAKESAEQKLTGARKDARNKIEKAEMEAESIIREATQQRQQVRQSIIRLLDRRKEIIGGIRSYLEMAQESLEQFSKDEAALFDLPADEDKFSDKLNEKAQRRTQSVVENENNDFEEEAQPLPPGAEDMDDIIDELD
ncbi:DivIVA domain-containing protein [Fodinibius halophilus]|uniref:DivIVA domain-containing protein n=1 Tax=Fodinibius halophilus TaxID=1736908 RepID=A0A6M1TAD6_9BACT|nr:DivIVA domain-containing protein [Fodinibius halophilus]NGP87312.1 DivIVA domain-containing protein [Fodinibius halophilus]